MPVPSIFQRLFTRNKEPSGGKKQEETVSVSAIPPYPPQIQVGSGQSVGRGREHNEDAIFTLTSTLADGRMQIPIGVFIVADGMGGQQYGEIASGVAVRTIATTVIGDLLTRMTNMGDQVVETSLHELLGTSIENAQQAVVKMAPGGGTTLTLAVVFGERVSIAHVGDSRAYFIFPDGKMESMTRDHSLVRHWVEIGQITVEEAAVHPQRNVLYRAVGQPEALSPDLNTYEIPEGARLLLCSDGLWGVVPEEDIARIVLSVPDLSYACQLLIDAANARGGPDNISAILCKF